MECYKTNGGCGVYENYSCSECPYSKPPQEKTKKKEPKKEEMIDNKVIHYKGKDYKIAKRNNAENSEFFELIESAIGKVTEAKSKINYFSVFSVNTEAVDMAYKIISSLNELYDFAEENGLYKPVDITPKFHYYKLFCFYSRKYTDSIYIKTSINIKDFVDEDDFLNALINNKVINHDDVAAIAHIDEVDEKTYREMTDMD